MKKYRFLVLLLIPGILISFSFYYIARSLEEEKTNALFQKEAADRVMAIKTTLNLNLLVVESVGNFYYSSVEVTRPEFSSFSSYFRDQVAGLHALEWIPNVSSQEVEQYVTRAREDGFPDFAITELTKEGDLIPAQQRKTYFPVYYIEPYEGNKEALGYDLGSNPSRLAAMLEARREDRITATSRIKLVQDHDDTFGFLLIKPVYNVAPNNLPPHKRAENLKGMVMGVFKIANIVNESLEPFHPSGVDIVLFDESASKEERFLYYYRSRLTPMWDQVSVEKRMEEKSKYFSKTDIKLGQRNWTAYSYATEQYIDDHKSFLPLLILIAGLLVSMSAATLFAEMYSIKILDRFRHLDQENESGNLRKFPYLEDE